MESGDQTVESKEERNGIIKEGKEVVAGGGQAHRREGATAGGRQWALLLFPVVLYGGGWISTWIHPKT